MDSPRIRLRVPAVVTVATSMVLSYMWLASTAIRQVQILASMIAVALGLCVTLVWFVFFSGASRRVRSAIAGLVAISVVLAAALFRFRGVTGDLIPIVEYRFAAPRVLPEAQQGAAPLETEVKSNESAPSPADSSASQAKPVGEVRVSGPVSTVSPPAPRETGRAHLDWPQFLGPARSGVVDGVVIDTDWTAHPPRLMWRQPVGAGWAGFAVSGSIAITQEQRGDEERVIAYELLTGRPLWSHADRTVHDSPLGGIGPRAVPTIDGGQVFTMGATGLLNALDLRTGKALWSRNVLKEGGAAEPSWGVSVSPLVHGPRVIVSAGGGPGRALMAYERNTGVVAWMAGDGGLSYSSPVILNLAGRDQIVMMNADSVAAHDPETGTLLWTQEFPRGQPNVAQPVALSGNRVLFSVGYGIGSKVFEVGPSEGASLSSKLVWSTPRLKSKFANVIAFEGSVYGLDDGVLVCLDPATGERRWKEGRFGHGQLILAGRHLIVQTEDGEVVLIAPSPDRLVETARFRALSSKTWNPPAFAAPFLLVRNDLEAAAFYLGPR